MSWIEILISLCLCYAELEIRLADGTEDGEGRVEVRRSWSEPWGTICDDSFDTAEVNIICYALGYA